MNEEFTKGHFEEPKIKIPRYGPGSPPKKYNVKKSISIFCCLWFSFGFRCPEVLRATITTKGDVYVIPYTEYGLRDFHLSYHESGKFHWGYEGTHIEPLCGKTDFAAAFGMMLKLRCPPCFCLRKGKMLSDGEIVRLVQRLTQNFPFPFDIEEACRQLQNAKFYRLVSVDMTR